MKFVIAVESVKISNIRWEKFLVDSGSSQPYCSPTDKADDAPPTLAPDGQHGECVGNVNKGDPRGFVSE